MNYKKSSRPVSRVLLLHRQIYKVPVIYLSDMSPCHFSGLPSDMERATLITPVYMTLQLPRRTARHVTMRLVGFYSTFSPLPYFPKKERRLFSSTLLYPHGQLSVRKWDALCCPDFPHTPKRKRQTDQLLLLGKDTTFMPVDTKPCRVF